MALVWKGSGDELGGWGTVPKPEVHTLNFAWQPLWGFNCPAGVKAGSTVQPLGCTECLPSRFSGGGSNAAAQGYPD